jgi:hypothetical protein
MRRAVPAFLLLVAATAPAMPNGARLEQRQRAQMEASDEILVYRTKDGDTLQGLAKRWFANPEDWRRAMALNKIKDPDSIPAGTALRLRSVWLKTNPISAELVAFRGDVRVVRKTAGLPVMKGMALSEGDIVETGPNGYATLTLPDRSQVSLPSASRIRLARLRQVPMSDSIDRRFTLEQGRSEARVTPMANPASRFLITTPVAVAAVRGTQYVVTYTPSEMKAVTVVTEGKVAVQRLGGIEDVLVRAGFGNMTTMNGATRPIALLPAPAVEMPERVQDSETVAFRIKPVAGAVRYRVEIASDAGFVDRVGSVEVDGLVASFKDVADGSYHVRAFALDALGLSGLPAEPVRFERSWTGNPAVASERRQAERRDQIAELATDQPADFNWFDGGNGGLLLAAAGTGGFGSGATAGGAGSGGGGEPVLPVEVGGAVIGGGLLLPADPSGGIGGGSGSGFGGGGSGGSGGFGGFGGGTGGGAGGGSGGGGGGGGGSGGGSGGSGSDGPGGSGGNGSSGPGGSGGIPGLAGGADGAGGSGGAGVSPTGPACSSNGGAVDGSLAEGCIGANGAGGVGVGAGGGGSASGSSGNGAGESPGGNGGNSDNSGNSGVGGAGGAPQGGPLPGGEAGFEPGPVVIETDPAPQPGAPVPPVGLGPGAPPPKLPVQGPGGPPVVPEPATWALLIAGFGLVGVAMRRRRVGRAGRAA